MPQEGDPFSLSKVYPEAVGIFAAKYKPASALEDPVFVLDTNALLLPYSIGKQTLSQIKSALGKLAKRGRLVVPGQVAREFAKNRAARLGEIHKKLLDTKSKVSPPSEMESPLLETLPSYREYVRAAEVAAKAFAEAAKAMDSVVSDVRKWIWDDPVSELYREFFSGSVIVETTTRESDLLKDAEFRFENNVPPGYKDKAKPDGGLGDLIIWHTILEIGADRKRDVVFVSAEEKADWFHRESGHPLYPRHELLDEFRRRTNGKGFQIMRFAELLERSGAPEQAVREVEVTEAGMVRKSKDLGSDRAIFDWLVKHCDVVGATMWQNGQGLLAFADKTQYSYAPVLRGRVPKKVAQVSNRNVPEVHCVYSRVKLSLAVEAAEGLRNLIANSRPEDALVAFLVTSGVKSTGKVRVLTHQTVHDPRGHFTLP